MRVETFLMKLWTSRRGAVPAWLLCLCVIALGRPAAHGQTIDWSQQFGTIETDEALAIAVDSSGVYAAGFTGGILPDLDKVGRRDAFVRKFNAAGAVLWTRQFGSEFDDEAKAIAAAGEAIYVAGDLGVSVAAQGDFDKVDGFLRKLDPSGRELWGRVIASAGGTPQDDRANAVATDSTGVYVAGGTAGVLPGQTRVSEWDGFLRKYDASGNELWTRQFGTSGFDTVVAVAANASGVFVLGETDFGFPGQTFAGGLYDIFLRQYDAAGNLLWARQFGTDGHDFPTAAVADATGLYIAGGTGGRLPEQVTGAGYDGFVRKYDNSGNVVWTRQFGLVGDVLAHGAALDATALYVVGNVFGTLPGQAGGGGANEDAFARKYDLNGNLIWTRQFGSEGADVASAAAVSLSNLYIAGGTPRVLLSPEPNGARDALVTRMAAGTPAGPVLFESAAVNAASYAGRAPLAPGSIASVFGLNLAGATSGGLVVQMNGISAPVFAATATQINFQIPWELAGASQAELKVTVSGAASAAIAVALAPVSPGLFATNARGTGQGAVLIANTASLAAPVGTFTGARPANRGESVTIYATGLGPVSSPPPTGVPASSNPLARTTSTPVVTLGGVIAPVSFAGLAPGFFGLYQINVQVPQSVAPGDAVPLVVSLGGASSNAVTIAVR